MSRVNAKHDDEEEEKETKQKRKRSKSLTKPASWLSEVFEEVRASYFLSLVAPIDLALIL